MTSIQETQITPGGLVVERNRLAKEANIQAFFKELRTTRPISTIYYPGPGFDDSLNAVFKPEEVTYIDRTPYFDGVLKGDLKKADFKDEVFDALFLQDIHQTRQIFLELLRVVKRGGLVVVSLYGCGIEPPNAMTVNDFSTHPQLTETNLVPNWKHLFRSFEKRSSI